MQNKILSICVPTYNRAASLINTLNSIFYQLDDEICDEIEIIVSDNGSTDNTFFTISAYKWIQSIRYERKEKNEGMDSNFLSCFTMATGDFVWLLSDDDVIRPDSLKQIISILRKYTQCGVLYMNSLWQPDVSYSSAMAVSDLLPEIITNNNDFIEKINYWVTFLSGNIVNKKAIQPYQMQTQFQGSHLVQLSWVLPAIYKSPYNLYVQEQVLLCTPENTGGYKLFFVFGKKLNLILDILIQQKKIDKAAKAIINHHLLESFFPMFLRKKGKFEKESILKILLPLYWKKRKFWKSILPLILKNNLKSRIPYL